MEGNRSPRRRTAWTAASTVVLVTVLIGLSGCSSPTEETRPGPVVGSATSAPPRRVVHVGITTNVKEPLGWRWNSATKSDDGKVAEGIDFAVPDHATDYWIEISEPDHFWGYEDDSDGLQPPARECDSVQCIHVVIHPDGTITLPERDNEQVRDVWFRFNPRGGPTTTR